MNRNTPARMDPAAVTPTIIGRRMTEADVTHLGTQLIQAWAAVEETKTEILRRLALVVIKLRSLHRTPGGLPDWAGRSWDYRQTVERMYADAGVPPDSASNIQAALRYHVGNYLRQLVDRKELEAVGLLPTSPKDRVQAARDEAAAILGLHAPEELPPSATRTRYFLSSIGKAVDTLEAEMERLTPEELSVVAETVASLSVRLKQLTTTLRKQGRR